MEPNQNPHRKEDQNIEIELEVGQVMISNAADVFQPLS
jgi:hypothetical protein